MRINKVLLPYINVEVERLVTNAINKSIDEEISNIEFDFSNLKEVENKLDERIEKELISIDNGFIDEEFIPMRIKNGRFYRIKNGILCDISIGSIRGSTLFSNIGPTIPIKLIFSSEINSNIDVDVSEYGINNAIIKVYFNVDIGEQITMPISSQRKKIKIKKMIFVDIFKGEIPDYYTGLIK